MYTIRHRTLLVCALFSSLIVGVPASAGGGHWHDDKDHWKEHWQHRNVDDEDEYDHGAGGCRFEPRDVWLVSDHFAGRYRPLPPGTAKKYYRTGALPADWQRQLAPLPSALERRLVALPEGIRRGVIGGSLIVYDPQTQTILDTIVLFGR